jgi:release factor glutamine methyltransferase
MTVLEVIQSTTDYFKKRGIENPRLNAEHLLAHVLGRKRLDLYLDFERNLAESELVPLRELVKRRGQGEPLQHLLGTVEFCGHTFLCDKRALVPRPETEQLVELLSSKLSPSWKALRAGGQALSEPEGSPSRRPSSLRAGRLSEPEAKFRIVDIGTGSGVIALSLAAKFPEAKIEAVDISDDALALARENAERLALSAQVQFTKSSLFENLDERFDVIVANLPYISMQDRHLLSREVGHDPAVALFGGERGDEFIRALIEKASSRLRPGGLLALEIGVGQSEALLDLLAQKNYHDIESKTDYSDTPRFLFARYG